MKPFTEVIEALRSEGVIVPLPGELGLEVSAGSQRLTSLDNLRPLAYCVWKTKTRT